MQWWIFVFGYMKWKSILFSVPISGLIFMAVGEVLNGRLERKVLLLVMCSNAHTHTHTHTSLLGRSTGVGCRFLLQGIFPPRGSDLLLLHPLHWQADLYHCTCRLGSPSVQHMLPYKVSEHARTKAFVCGHIFIELFSFWNSQSKDFQFFKLSCTFQKAHLIRWSIMLQSGSL